MPQTAPTIPQEIIEDIVDCVAHEDFDSLRAVARASRYFLERSRRHLFRNVYLGDVLCLPPGTWKIFHKNPSLFKYARRMIIQARLPGFDVTETVLREVLGHIKDLKEADIDVMRNYEKWSQFGIFDLCPDITHLSIHFNHDMPLNIFYSFPRLEELRITYRAHYRSSPGPLDESTLSMPPWHLKSLHYHSSTAIHLPLLLAPRLDPHVYGGLGHLSLDVETLESHSFLLSRILPACLNSPLETLRLWYGGRFSSWRSYTTVVPHVLEDPTAILSNKALPSHASLRYLSIGIRSSREHVDQPHQFALPRSQAKFLSTLLDQTIQPALEAIDLAFSWGTRSLNEADLRSQQLVVRDSGWEWADSILASRALFPHLRAVRITAHIEDQIRPGVFEKFHSTDHPELARIFKEQVLVALPGTRDRGLLLDFGLEETKRDYDRIVDLMIDRAWSYTQSPYISGYLGL